ncbi:MULTISPECIES: MFS transporter [unclassified Agrobacterium]|uniref:MFS transporter n=1 Tax=unclassified Agrobacterium TaxID=2632611 RepID=UPI002446AE36|nr:MULTISPECIES: MFS transporter [unclassified Agrobacterium]MDH0612159.1 MFS transporter [Agrobacterium sp. GD03872]MDH0696056.1 MFS transporter [Agrobacterium sp. GD03871]MDH1058670.1 MFS transporter [Agrobacterium sp. GD03992]MDH2210761.1 MFS transporter [Agrobacterium sp. GD03643]MDH2217823.1 MFS transporter [Agrobacterium sp. GD03638]
MRSPNRWLVLLAVIAAFTPVVVDMTILHIAVPSLTVALGASGTEVLWIIDIYPLVVAGMLVPMGTLADRIGYRHMLLTGLTVFTAASVAAAFSLSAPMLIAARAALGVGASMIMPCVLAVIRQTFEDESERATALGVWSVVGSAGAAIGPLAGGFLLEHFWWGSVFLVNVPIMMAVIPMVWLLTPAAVSGRGGEWKIGQALILVAGLISTVYAIKTGFKSGIGVSSVVPFVFGVSLLTFFGRLQVSSVTPMLDLSLLVKPAIAVGFLMAFVASGALAGFELVLAQELQFVLEKSPLEAGLFMMPLVVAAAIGGPVGGRLAHRFGLRPVASLSMAVAALSLVGLAYADFVLDAYLVTSLLAALGFSLGVGLLASSIAIMSSAPAQKAGAAGALESTGYELGGGLGITFFGVMVNSIFQSAYTGPNSGGVANSIGEAITAAERIGGHQGEAIIVAARLAFADAHGLVLILTGALVALLAISVFWGLRNVSTSDVRSH